MAESRFAELKEKEKQARKQIVIESALALFAKKPFYEVGMREVADEAGISLLPPYIDISPARKNCLMKPLSRTFPRPAKGLSECLKMMSPSGLKTLP